MKVERPDFDLEKFVKSIEENGVEKTLVEVAKNLALLTWKVSQQRPESKEK